MLCFSISSSLLSQFTLSIVSTLFSVVNHLQVVWWWSWVWWRGWWGWWCLSIFTLLIMNVGPDFHLTFSHIPCPRTSWSWWSCYVPSFPQSPRATYSSIWRQRVSCSCYVHQHIDMIWYREQFLRWSPGGIIIFIHLNSSHDVIAQLPLDTFIDPRKEAKWVKDVGLRSSEKIITFIEKE